MSAKTIAAVDLGSNSFHLIVAEVVNDELRIIDRLKEMVRLGAGLDEKRRLDQDTSERAIACLERFGQRLRELDTGQVQAVGTNTLRTAHNPNQFLKKARMAIGHPIKIISGMEEARLIYQGVSHGFESASNRRIVIDIGGGSTEIIIGDGYSPLYMESLYMGCVSMTRKFFPEGIITKKRMKKAVLAGRVELEPHETHLRQLGWQQVVGSSGTFKAVANVLIAMRLSDNKITLDALKQLRNAIIEFGQIDKITLPGLSEQRAPVFAGGVAIVIALFKSLKIEEMEVSDWALREGLLYDMVGRMHRDDIRDRTVHAWVERMQIDRAHAQRVTDTVLRCLDMIGEVWDLQDEEARGFLTWAAQLHEIGMTIAHSHYNRHGAYIIENADMQGFSRQEQSILAFLVQGHRRKFPVAEYDDASLCGHRSLLELAVILRLAVILNRSRSNGGRIPFLLSAGDKLLDIRFPKDWLDEHPLTKLDLEQEKKYLAAIDYQIMIS